MLHARRPTSGRYAFRTLATCTRATVVTRADAGSRRSHCCGTHHAASPGIDQSSRNMLSLHKGRGGSQAVYRYSGLATLMRAGQPAPLLWHQPKRSHYCGAARWVIPPSWLAARSHRRQISKPHSPAVGVVRGWFEVPGGVGQAALTSWTSRVAGVCLRTRTQTGQARAPRALWSAPYRL